MFFLPELCEFCTLILEIVITLNINVMNVCSANLQCNRLCMDMYLMMVLVGLSKQMLIMHETYLYCTTCFSILFSYQLVCKFYFILIFLLLSKRASLV